VPAMLRLGAWGIGAAFAVVVAVFAANANFGAHRTTPAPPVVATPAPAPEPMRPTTAAQLLARANEPDAETRRLAEAVRMLTTDRDRLTTRISAIERTMDDLTGSIARLPPAAPPAPPRSLDTPPPSGTAPGPQAAPSFVLPAPLAAMPTSAPAPMPATNPPPMPRPAIAMPAPMPDPAPLTMTTREPLVAPSDPPRSGRMATIEYYTRSATDPAGIRADDPANSVATATDFGIDLGGASSVNGLRALWATIRSKHAQLLNGLWPVMVIRDRPKQPGVVELRLVAGPLPNAGHAAKLCAAFAPLGVACQPAVFDGQRLALR
jgi:hypothetical protein